MVVESVRSLVSLSGAALHDLFSTRRRREGEGAYKREKEREGERRERELNIEISISSSEQLNADRISRENGHHAGGGCSGCARAPQLLQFVSTLSTHPICICSFLPNFLAKQGHALAPLEGRRDG